jgi:hypothetical protein
LVRCQGMRAQPVGPQIQRLVLQNVLPLAARAVQLRLGVAAGERKLQWRKRSNFEWSLQAPDVRGKGRVAEVQKSRALRYGVVKSPRKPVTQARQPDSSMAAGDEPCQKKYPPLDVDWLGAPQFHWTALCEHFSPTPAPRGLQMETRKTIRQSQASPTEIAA